MNNKKMLLIAALIVVASGSSSLAQTDRTAPTIPETQIQPKKVATPYEFVSAASSGDEFEVKAGTLAMTKSQSSGVKALAQMTIDDHTAALKELSAAGMADKVDIAAPSPDGEQQGMLGKLDQAQGPEFDKRYVEAQLFAHQRAIALFRGYAEGDTNLNRYAAKTLPTLIKHYQAALDLAAKLSLDKAAQ